MISQEALILVVEDDDAVRQLIRAALIRHGFDVHAVRSATAALDYEATSERPPDLLLTDLSLPDHSGVELAGELTDLHPNMSVLFASDYTPEEFSGGRPSARRTEFLQKPFSVEDLLDAVRVALGVGPNGENGEPFSAEAS